MQNFYQSYQGGTGFTSGQDNSPVLPAYTGGKENSSVLPAYTGAQDNFPVLPSFTGGKDNFPVLPSFTGGKDNFPVLPTETGCQDNFPTFPACTGFPDNFPTFPSFSNCPTCPTAANACPTCLNAQPYDIMPVQGQYCNEALTRIIQECQATCEYLTTHLKCRCDPRARRNQLIIVRDCADICATNARFVPRGSVFDKQTVFVCGCICECCAQECARFNDRLSQQAALVCCECAKACFAFVS